MLRACWAPPSVWHFGEVPYVINRDYFVSPMLSLLTFVRDVLPVCPHLFLESQKATIPIVDRWSVISQGNPPHSLLLLSMSQNPSPINASSHDENVMLPSKSLALGKKNSWTSAHGAFGSMHAKPPSTRSPQVCSSESTQVHSQQSPPSYPDAGAK